jgi:transposase
MRTLTLNTPQQRRAEILTQLVAGKLSTADAAQLLQVRHRQVQRLRRRFLTQGISVAVHGNQGRAPVNRTDPALIERLHTLCGPSGKYHDFNISHLCDLLATHEKIKLARSTLSRLLHLHGLRSKPRSRPEVKRLRRERKSSEGMMLQIDATPFDWLESRAPRMALTAAVDDATGKIIYGCFRPTEDQFGYLVMLRSIATSYGLPHLLYHDRHTILRSPKEPSLEDELAGRPPMSQFQRVVASLGVSSIAALSPQAKGRIERLWRTLQDRLTKELRLAQINSLEDSNRFLPAFIESYNDRFGHLPREAERVWRSLPQEMDLDYYFSTCEQRQVRRDHTITWLGQVLQLVPEKNDPSLVMKKVEVHVTPEGQLSIYDGARRVQHREVVTSAGRRPIRNTAVRHPVPNAAPDPQSDARRRGWLYGKVR